MVTGLVELATVHMKFTKYPVAMYGTYKQVEMLLSDDRNFSNSNWMCLYPLVYVCMWGYAAKNNKHTCIDCIQLNHL